MTLMPMVYVTDMNRSVAFYEQLGGEVSMKGRTEKWSELRIGGALLALHWTEELPKVEEYERVSLNFVAQEPLEPLDKRLESASIPTGDIIDEAFGRILILKDPDGLSVQVNEHDQDLYT